MQPEVDVEVVVVDVDVDVEVLVDDDVDVLVEVLVDVDPDVLVDVLVVGEVEVLAVVCSYMSFARRLIVDGCHSEEVRTYTAIIAAIIATSNSIIIKNQHFIHIMVQQYRNGLCWQGCVRGLATGWLSEWDPLADRSWPAP